MPLFLFRFPFVFWLQNSLKVYERGTRILTRRKSPNSNNTTIFIINLKNNGSNTALSRYILGVISVQLRAAIYQRTCACCLAKLQVNISGQKSDAIKEELKSSISNFDTLVQSYRSGAEGSPPIQLARDTDVSLFSTAKSEILRLMKTDPFVRWKQAVRENGLQEENSLASNIDDPGRLSVIMQTIDADR